MKALDAIRPEGTGDYVEFFSVGIADRLTDQIGRQGAGLTDWESFGGHSGREGMVRRMAQNVTLAPEDESQGGCKESGWVAATSSVAGSV